MRQIRETLRLHLQAGLSYNEVGRALKTSKSVVGKYVLLARVAGVDWALAQSLSDEDLEARLYRPAVPRSSHQLAPDFALVHQELKRAGVTLMLLWEEYATANPQAYKYTGFCIKYREFAQRHSARCARSTSPARSCSSTTPAPPYRSLTPAPVRSPRRRSSWPRWVRRTTRSPAPRRARPPPTGSARRCRRWSSSAATGHVGAPSWPMRLVVPDQTRALIKTPDRYDPEPNRTYEEFARHYGCAVLAARPRHPRDKPKVEGSVLLVQRWILARLRNRQFFTLAELNRAIAELLVDLNQRPFKKLPGCRRSAFESLDAPGAAALADPALRHQPLEDCQGQHRLPRRVRGPLLQRAAPPRRRQDRRARHRQSAGVLRVQPARGRPRRKRRARRLHHDGRAHAGQRATKGPLRGPYRAHLEWTPAKLIAWGQRIGVSTAAVVTWQLEHRPHPEQGYRACLGACWPWCAGTPPSGWRPPARAPWRSARPTCAA